MNVEYTILKMHGVNMDARTAPKIRGYFASKYMDNPIFHNHDNSKMNRLIYSYPLIQYKVIDNIPCICGIKEGAKPVMRVGLEDDEMVVGCEKIDICKKEIKSETVRFGEMDDYIGYEFKTPWMALNQKNTKLYESMSEIEKEELLKKILIGNIISLSKGIGYNVESRLSVWINLSEKNVNMKEVKMRAFTGEFKVNFNIPDYLGIGKSVSRGFGSVAKKA